MIKIEKLNLEIELTRQLINGNKYQATAFENVIKAVVEVLAEKDNKIKALENPIVLEKSEGEV